MNLAAILMRWDPVLMIYTPAMRLPVCRYLPCFTCPECLKGFYSQCAKYDFIGSRRDGGFAEYIVVKRNNVFALPADMPIEDGAFY